MNGSVCVIGGNGFLGGHIVDALRHEGIDTAVFARRPDPYRPALQDVRYVYGDFTNADQVTAAVKGMECVVHCLTTTTVHSSNADMVHDIDSNLLSTVRLLQACVTEGVKRVVFVSSGGTVYGPPQIVPTPEDHPLFPICSYGIVKSAIEQYLHLFHVLHGLNYATLRLSNPYGPRQNPDLGQGVIGIFAAKVLKREPIRIFGDSSAVRDYLYAADFALAVMAALKTDHAAMIVNIGSGQGTSLNDIIDILRDTTGIEPEVVRAESRGADVPRSILDVTRARNQLGWHATTGLVDGIAAQVAWLRGLGCGQS